MATTVLYTPAVLGLAVDLAGFPLDESLPLIAEARSPTCGSKIRLGLSIDQAGAIARLGAAVQACAIGQAASAIFLKGAMGMDLSSLVASREQVRDWLAGKAGLPDWPDLDVLSAVPAYPGRHGAVLLAWNAAIEALS